jgi:hypothetical protein
VLNKGTNRLSKWHQEIGKMHNFPGFLVITIFSNPRVRMYVLVALLLVVCQAATQGPSKTDRIAIIGGGPSGIATAHFLKAEGVDPDNIVIYEQANRIGGFVTDLAVGGSIMAMTTYAGTDVYGTVRSVMTELGVTSCPFVVDPSYPGVFLSDGTVTSMSLLWIQIMATDYQTTYASIDEFQGAIAAALAKYSQLYTSLYGTNEYLFPHVRRTPAQLADLSKPARQFLEDNDLQILVFLLRRFDDTQGYGPLETITAFHMFQWSPPSVLVQREAFYPCAGFQSIVDKMAVPFRVRLNTDITSVKRTDTCVTVTTRDGDSQLYDWIYFANKFHDDSLNFDLDLRADETALFDKLESVHLKTTLVRADEGYHILDGAVFLVNGDFYVDPAGTATVGCHNDPVGRHGVSLPVEQMVCFEAYYYPKSSQADEQFDAFVSLLNEDGPGTPLSYTTPSTFETTDYFPKFSSTEFATGAQWDLWDLQGKYRSFYVSAAFSGMESFGHVVDYAKQVVELYVDTSGTSEPSCSIPEPEPEPCSSTNSISWSLLPLFFLLIQYLQ